MYMLTGIRWHLKVLTIYEPHLEKNRIFAYAKTKSQISCAVTAQLIIAFVFVTQIVQFLFFLNPNFQAIFCRCTGRFVSDLVGNPVFSRGSSYSVKDEVGKEISCKPG